jgi:LuxR family transcriptional regulator, maltose regulon positive regulatory protein
MSRVMQNLSSLPSRRAEQAHESTIVTAMVLGAIAREALGSPYAARQALEHALGLAEADVDADAPFPVSVPPAPGQRRARGALTNREARVLRYLPTHLSTREIAAELYVSTNTVKTHQRHLYAKLGAHSRAQAVDRARVLGLLTPLSNGGHQF